MKQAHNQTAANKPIVLNRMQDPQPNIQSEIDRGSEERRNNSTTTPLPPPQREDKPKSDSDHQLQNEVDLDVQNFLRSEDVKRLTVVENRHQSTFSDFRNGNILNLNAVAGTKKVNENSASVMESKDKCEKTDDMEWAPSDAKFLKQKRDVVGVESSDVKQDSQAGLGGNGGVGSIEGGACGRGNSTYVVNVVANSSHGHSSLQALAVNKSTNNPPADKRKVTKTLPFNFLIQHLL